MAANGLRLRGYVRRHLLRVRHLRGNSLRWTTGTTRAPLPTPPATAPTVLRSLPRGDAAEQRLDRGADLLLHKVPDHGHEASLSWHRSSPCRRQIHESPITGKVLDSAPGVVEEDVHENAADRDVEPDRKRHPRQPPVAVEATAPRAVDGCQCQRHHQRRQHYVRDEKTDVDGAQPC